MHHIIRTVSVQVPYLYEYDYYLQRGIPEGRAVRPAPPTTLLMTGAGMRVLLAYVHPRLHFASFPTNV